MSSVPRPFALALVLALFACDGGGARTDGGTDAAADSGDAAASECDRGAFANNALIYAPETGRHEDLLILPESLRGYTRIEGAVTVDGDVDLTPLHCLREIGGGLAVFHRDLPLAGFEQLRTLGLTLQIDSNRAMPDLQPLAGLRSIGTLAVNSNQALGSLDGLSGLREIGGDLQVGGNAAMESLDGLREVDVRGGISVLSNPVLTDVGGLSALKSLGVLKNEAPDYWGNLNFENNPMLDACDVRDAVAELSARAIDASGSNCGNLSDACGEPACPTEYELVPGR